jgi:hypothetical protein
MAAALGQKRESPALGFRDGLAGFHLARSILEVGKPAVIEHGAVTGLGLRGAGVMSTCIMR